MCVISVHFMQAQIQAGAQPVRAPLFGTPTKKENSHTVKTVKSDCDCVSLQTSRKTADIMQNVPTSFFFLFACQIFKASEINLGRQFRKFRPKILHPPISNIQDPRLISGDPLQAPIVRYWCLVRLP